MSSTYHAKRIRARSSKKSPIDPLAGLIIFADFGRLFIVFDASMCMMHGASVVD